MQTDGRLDALFRAALLRDIAVQPQTKCSVPALSRVARRRRLTGEGLFRHGVCRPDAPYMARSAVCDGRELPQAPTE